MTAPIVRSVSVRNETRGCIVASRTVIANNSASRRKGLLGCSSLPEDHGLWILPCESVHTCGMKFQIDLVYLDRDIRVRKIRRRVAPWRFSICLSAHSVLELPAGIVDQTGTRPGDQLSFYPADAQS
jgi:uncharacterized membrane protein (UPF0127 family)